MNRSNFSFRKLSFVFNLKAKEENLQTKRESSKTVVHKINMPVSKTVKLEVATRVDIDNFLIKHIMILGINQPDC